MDIPEVAKALNTLPQASEAGRTTVLNADCEWKSIWLIMRKVNNDFVKQLNVKSIG